LAAPCNSIGLRPIQSIIFRKLSYYLDVYLHKTFGRNHYSFCALLLTEKSFAASSGAIRSDVKVVNLGSFSGEKSCGL
jgi:hypothetical protein